MQNDDHFAAQLAAAASQSALNRSNSVDALQNATMRIAELAAAANLRQMQHIQSSNILSTQAAAAALANIRTIQDLVPTQNYGLVSQTENAALA